MWGNNTTDFDTTPLHPPEKTGQAISLKGRRGGNTYYAVFHSVRHAQSPFSLSS